MSGYTLKNLMDVEDRAKDQGSAVEARLGRPHIDSEHLGVSYFRYAPGFRSPVGHHHREQEARAEQDSGRISAVHGASRCRLRTTRAHRS